MKAQGLLRRYGPRALGELAIIIAGVSIALGFQSLEERRDARREEQRYLLELQVDFRTNVASLEQVLERERQGEETAIALLSAIHQSGSSPHPDSVRAWFLRSLYHGGEPTLAEGTLHGMIQTGSLGLIEDRNLRSVLAAFASQLPRDLDLMRYWADTAFQTLATNPYFKREVGAYELFSDEIRQQRGLPTSNRFPVDFRRLVTEKEFGGLAQDAYIMRRNRRLAVERLAGAGRAVLQDLDRVLAEGT